MHKYPLPLQLLPGRTSPGEDGRYFCYLPEVFVDFLCESAQALRTLAGKGARRHGTWDPPPKRRRIVGKSNVQL
eukprot:7505943-Karenia_brevis.AAC.1